MTEWRLPLLKKNIIYCPELVDHYKDRRLRPRPVGLLRVDKRPPMKKSERPLFQLQEPLKRFNQVVGRSKFAHHLIDSSLVTTMLVHG